MTALPRKRCLSAEQRRALELLADIAFSVTDTAMLVNGFARLVGLVRTGAAIKARESEGWPVYQRLEDLPPPSRCGP
jgi:hypothetical protein